MADFVSDTMPKQDTLAATKAKIQALKGSLEGMAATPPMTGRDMVGRDQPLQAPAAVAAAPAAPAAPAAAPAPMADAGPAAAGGATATEGDYDAAGGYVFRVNPDQSILIVKSPRSGGGKNVTATSNPRAYAAIVQELQRTYPDDAVRALKIPTLPPKTAPAVSPAGPASSAGAATAEATPVEQAEQAEQAEEEWVPGPGKQRPSTWSTQVLGGNIKAGPSSPAGAGLEPFVAGALTPGAAAGAAGGLAAALPALTGAAPLLPAAGLAAAIAATGLVGKELSDAIAAKLVHGEAEPPPPGGTLASNDPVIPAAFKAGASRALNASPSAMKPLMEGIKPARIEAMATDVDEAGVSAQDQALPALLQGARAAGVDVPAGATVGEVVNAVAAAHSIPLESARDWAMLRKDILSGALTEAGPQVGRNAVAGR